MKLVDTGAEEFALLSDDSGLKMKAFEGGVHSEDTNVLSTGFAPNVKELLGISVLGVIPKLNPVPLFSVVELNPKLNFGLSACFTPKLNAFVVFWDSLASFSWPGLGVAHAGQTVFSASFLTRHPPHSHDPALGLNISDNVRPVTAAGLADPGDFGLSLGLSQDTQELSFEPLTV